MITLIHRGLGLNVYSIKQGGGGWYAQMILGGVGTFGHVGYHWISCLFII